MAVPDYLNQSNKRIKRGAVDPEADFQTDHLLPVLGRHTARGGLVMISGHGLKFAIAILGTAIMARLLAPEDYGLIGMVTVVTNFVSLFTYLGLSFPTVQRAEIKFEQISTLFWTNLGVSLVIAAGMAAIAPGIAWFYGEPKLTKIAVIIGIGFVFGGLAVQHDALLRRQMRFFALSTISLISMLMGYAVGITLARSGFGYWALVYSQLAVLAAYAIGVILVSRWRPGPPKFTAESISMLKFGGDITGYSILNYFAKNSDSLLIGRFWGAPQLGFYSKATQLSGLPIDQLDEPLAAVAIPALSRLVGQNDRYRQAYLRMLEKVMLLILPPIAWIVITSDWLVSVVLGPRWSYTGTILVFIGLGMLVQPVINTVTWLFISQGRSRAMLRWAVLNAPVSLIAILAGLPWGPTGVAAAYCIARLLVLAPLSIWLAGKAGPVSASDIFRCTAPLLLAVTCALLSGLAFRTLFRLGNPILGMSAEAAVIGGMTVLMLLVIPSGRKALIDVRRTWFSLGSMKIQPTVLPRD